MRKKPQNIAAHLKKNSINLYKSDRCLIVSAHLLKANYALADVLSGGEEHERNTQQISSRQ